MMSSDNKKLLAVSLVAIGLILSSAAIGGHLIWKGVLEHESSILAQQIKSSVYNQISEGNLFAATAALSRLKTDGVAKDTFIFQQTESKLEPVFSSVSDIEAALKGRADVQSACDKANQSVFMEPNNQILLVVPLKNSSDKHVACAIISASVSTELVRLRSIVYASFALIATISILYFLALTIRLTKQRVATERSAAEQRAESAIAMSNLATQIAHDIRAPLSVLNMLVSEESGLSSEKRDLVRNVVNRVNDIANSLLIKRRTQSTDANATNDNMVDATNRNQSRANLVSLVRKIVEEKRIQSAASSHVNILVDIQCPELTQLRLDDAELTRALSNLIDNSIESLSGSGGEVKVALIDRYGGISISVEDNGIGIPTSVLNRIGERGFSFGKSSGISGAGLGVHYAREFTEKNGGKFLIQSMEGKGTSVQLIFQKLLLT